VGVYVLEHFEADISILSANIMVVRSTSTCSSSQYEPPDPSNRHMAKAARYTMCCVEETMRPKSTARFAGAISPALASVGLGSRSRLFAEVRRDEAGRRVLLASSALQCVAIIRRGAKLLVLLCAEGSDSMLALPLSPLPALALALPVRLLIGAFGGGKGLLTPACCST